ncbi:MAG: aminodeoxychorismate synthase component I [bacterium]
MRAIHIEDIPYQDNAETLFDRLRDLPGAVWLDSGKPRSLYGRFDIISALPQAIISARDGLTVLERSGETTTSGCSPFVVTNQLMREYEPVPDDLKSYPFVGGAIGFWSYDFGNRQMGIRTGNTADTALPEARLGLYLWSLVINHSTRKAYLFIHRDCPKDTIEQVRQRLSARPSDSQPFRLTEPFRPEIDDKTHIARVQRAKSYISAGDIYQVNLAQRFSASFTGDPWTAYRLLRHKLPSPFSCYMAWDDQAILSLSPERFLKLSMSKVEARPIKGTIRRANDTERDQELAVHLQNSAKDRAENLMIVDLLRNDLGKTCVPGSIKVPKLFGLESFKNVHHLVSTVTGTLDQSYSAMDLLDGCFPGGSITGAPKKRAMEIIAELEGRSRGIYCGSIGYLSFTGRMDTNIAIRTLYTNAGEISCWGGGGIVADSNPAQEYEESLTKIRLLMETLEENPAFG